MKESLKRPENYGQPSVDTQPKGDKKIGVFWHTQGSGKSLSMVFFSGKIVQRSEMEKSYRSCGY